MYEILKFLHIVLMFTAVSLLVGGEFYLSSMKASGDVRAIRAGYRAGKKLDGIGVAALLLGAGFGVIAALNGSLDLTQNWLLTAYGIFVAIMVMGIAYWTPRSKRILEAAEASPDDTASPALAALINQPKDRLALVLDLALWAGIIFVMVVKPFS